LASATTKVLLTAVTGFTRLLNPTFTMESLKCFGGLPDFAPPFLFHILKVHTRNHGCRVAGKNSAAARNEDEFAPPAANTRFGKFCIVVGDDEHEPGAASEAFLGFLQDRHAIGKLLASGHQVCELWLSRDPTRDS
jgi:hypothetical protein